MPDEKPDLRLLADIWQKRLRLQDWDVDIQYKRHFETWNDMPIAGEVASCLVTKRHATINILDPIDFSPTWAPAMDIELTVVHELVHLHIAPFYNEDSNPQMEQAVHALSSALVAAYRNS